MVSHRDENEEELKLMPTLSIHQLKDNPDVDKPFSLSFLISVSLGNQLLLERRRVR